MARDAIESPCVKVCAVDGRLGQCLGCGRTLPEIAGWGQRTPEERRAIMDQLPARLEALNARDGAAAQ
ncbi:MAG: DUF1289 domain-containing protein [Pseudomonadota bacterium]